MRTPSTSFRLPPSARNLLSRLACATGVDKTEVVCVALQRYDTAIHDERRRNKAERELGKRKRVVK